MDKNIKKTEEELMSDKLAEDVRELDRYINEFSTFLPTPICLLTPTQTMVDVNTALKNLTGYDEVELLGEDISKLFKNKRKAGALRKNLRQMKIIHNKQFELLTNKKKTIIVNISASPRKDENDNYIGYFIAFSDISELKKLQSGLEEKVRERTAKIEEEQNKIKAIISNLVDPVIVIDKDRRLTLYNQAARRVLKISPGAIGRKVGRKSKRLPLTDFKDIIKINFRIQKTKYTEKNKIASEEVIISKKKKKTSVSNPFLAGETRYEDNSQVYKVLTAPVLGRRNKPYGYMKIFYNLTREKMIDQMKSEFISIAAHQLRTPLSAIKWAISMVLEGDTGSISNEQREYLNKGFESNERIIRIVNDMLDVSRIEEGRFGYTYAKHNFKEILNSCLRDIKAIIKKNSINLEVYIPKVLSPVTMDKEKITMAFQNLLENAVKYTPMYGSIKVDVSEGAKQIIIKIIDNGVGIPKNQQKKLFTKFFRAENVVRMQTEGSGLGLFIVKNIIKQHKGFIAFDSREGVGTEFIITLPIDRKS